MANPDLEKILALLLDTARGMLDGGSDFMPFAAVIDRAGRLALMDAEPPEEDMEVPIFVEAIRMGLKRAADAGDIVAGGLCADVHVGLPGGGSSDAISAQLEHESGESFDVCLPYKLEPEGPSYAEPFAGLGQPWLFAIKNAD